MKTNKLFRLIPLFLISSFAIGCSHSSSNKEPLEKEHLKFEIRIEDRNDYQDFNYLATNITYVCDIELVKEIKSSEEPVFTYNHDLADIKVITPPSKESSSRSFCLAIKGTESTNFELKIEWRNHDFLKTYSITKSDDIATCLCDHEIDANQRENYEDFSVIDSQQKYDELKNSIKYSAGTYKFPDKTFENSFLLVRNFYVSDHYPFYKYNKCFLFKEKIYVDYKEEFSSGDMNMTITGVHFTLLEFPNEYKNHEFVSHSSAVDKTVFKA